MKMIDLSCTKCGATLQINPELSKCICQYCGNEMLIDEEIQQSEITNGFDLGYQAELGRQKAMADIEKERQQLLAKEELKQRKKDIEDFKTRCIGLVIIIIAMIAFFNSCNNTLEKTNGTKDNSNIQNEAEHIKENIDEEAYNKGQQMGADAANYLNDLMSK